MATRARQAAIVGIHEYPSRDVEGAVTPLQIKTESALRALEDAGLTIADVDGIYDAGDGGMMSGLAISEYAPTQIKQALVGRGHADKAQVQHMVKALLELGRAPAADAADALGAAVCHAHMREGLARIALAGGRA